MLVSTTAMQMMKNEEEDEEDSPQPPVARADPLPGERTVRRRVGPTREESRAEAS